MYERYTTGSKECHNSPLSHGGDTTVPEQSLDESIINELRDIMRSEFSELIQAYIKDSLSRIDTLQQAITSADADQVRSLAHSLKGSSLNLGALKVVEYCRDLENRGKNVEWAGIQEIYDALKLEFDAVINLMEALD